MLVAEDLDVSFGALPKDPDIRRSGGEPHDKFRALALTAVQFNRAVVKIDNSLDEIQTDPATDDSRRVAAAKVALEDTLLVLFRNADSVVFERHDDLRAVSRGAYLDEGLARRVIGRVRQQIAKYLVQEAPIAVGR